jgi:hypothetical protein
MHGCAATVILIILYFFYQERALGFGRSMPSGVRHDTTHRIVVFGNDWSDTRSNRVSTDLQLLDAARDPAHYGLWTESLCKEVRLGFDLQRSNR